MPRFSIIIPAFNVEKYVEKCVYSVINQNYKDYEILLINDGSTDRTLAICKNLAKEYQKIRLFSKENEGLSETRNYGIKRACGDYLYFLDADDLMEIDALSNIDSCLKNQNNPDIIITNYIKFDDRSGEETDIEHMPEFSFEANTVSICRQFAQCYVYGDMAIISVRFLVKREYIIDKSLFFEKGILHEDELWSPQVFLNAHSVGYCRKSCYRYRYNREGSITQTGNIKNLKHKIYVIDKLVELADSSPDEVAKMYCSRAACLLNGVLTSDIKDSSGEIALEIKKRMHIFLKSIQKKYTVLYILLKILGIKNTVKIEKRFINEN